MLIHVHLVRSYLARALHLFVPRLVRRWLERYARHAARLPCGQYSANHVHIRVCGPWTQCYHERVVRDYCSTRQLASLSAQSSRVCYPSNARCNQVRLHLKFKKKKRNLTTFFLHIFFLRLKLSIFYLFFFFLASLLRICSNSNESN